MFTTGVSNSSQRQFEGLSLVFVGQGSLQRMESNVPVLDDAVQKISLRLARCSEDDMLLVVTKQPGAFEVRTNM